MSNQSLKRQTILITGVNGFIGQYASRSLANQHIVIGVAKSASLSASLALPQPTVQMIYADLSAPDFVGSLPSNIDCVVHLAQSQLYRAFPEGADDMRHINVDATCHLLEWARKSNVKQFIFTSTANVYGRSMDLLTESNLTQPESFYGASKLAAEHLARPYHKFFQVDILRLFTVYGPGQKGMLIPNIIERIRTGQPITLAKGVGLFMTPIYVDDVVTTIRKLIETPAQTPVRLLNVCGDKVSHLGEIVKALEAATGLQANIQTTDEETQYFTGANTTLKRCLGRCDFTNIESGLELVVNGNLLFH